MYFDKVAWLKSAIWDFEKETQQKTIKPKKHNAELSKVKWPTALFLKRTAKMINSNTVVNNCLGNKNGSAMEPEKTNGSKAK